MYVCVVPDGLESNRNGEGVTVLTEGEREARPDRHALTLHRQKGLCRVASSVHPAFGLFQGKVLAALAKKGLISCMSRRFAIVVLPHMKESGYGVVGDVSSVQTPR